MTIPADVLKLLDLDVESTLELQVSDGDFTTRPVRPIARERYTLAELLRGVTPDVMAELTADTAWAREGKPVGRERA